MKTKTGWWDHPQWIRYNAIYQRIETLKHETMYKRGLQKAKANGLTAIAVTELGRNGIMGSNDPLALHYQKLCRVQSRAALHGLNRSGFSQSPIKISIRTVKQ